MVSALWYMYRYSAGAESPIIANSYRDLFPGKEYCTEICKISSLLLLDEVPGIKFDPRAPKLYCPRLERVCGKSLRASAAARLWLSVTISHASGTSIVRNSVYMYN